MNLTSTVAIVTGAASGLGYGGCCVVVESGANVLGVDIDERKFGKLHAEFGDNAGTDVADVSGQTSAARGRHQGDRYQSRRYVNSVRHAALAMLRNASDAQGERGEIGKNGSNDLQPVEAGRRSSFCA